MKALCAVVHRRGAAIAPALIDALERALGPVDSATGRASDNGCALLTRPFWREARGTDTRHGAGNRWLAADARIDDRETLGPRLGLTATAAKALPDDDCLALALARWGERAVEHLVGDFAFVRCDPVAGALFAACDPLGARPLYFALTRDYLAVSNIVACLRALPGFDDRFDEVAVADFLLFDFPLEDDATIFRGLRRVPPGSTLVFERNGFRIDRYRTEPAVEPPGCADPRDCVAQFREVFARAVADRVPATGADVLMSGGIDSTYVAACAADAVGPDRVRAISVVYESLIPDREREFIDATAGALGIRSEFISADDVEPLRLMPGESAAPLPSANPFEGLLTRQLRAVASGTGVALTGWDGDSFFTELPSLHFEALAREGRWSDFTRDVARYVHHHRRPPPLGLRTALRRAMASQREPRATLPDWIDPAWARRFDVEARAREIRSRLAGRWRRGLAAGAALDRPSWRRLFEMHHPGHTGLAVDVRHPWLDVRVIALLRGMPTIPWLTHKHLVRTAARGALPERVLARPKTALSADPLRAQAARGALEWTREVQMHERMREIMIPSALPPLSCSAGAEELWQNLRPYSLSLWLDHQA